MDKINIYEEIEIWSPIEDFSNYEVSNQGNIKNKTSQQILKNWLQGLNYCVGMTNNSGKNRSIPIKKLVAIYFVKNPYNFSHIEHIDLNKTNNNYKNIRWIKQCKNINKNEYIGKKTKNGK